MLCIASVFLSSCSTSNREKNWKQENDKEYKNLIQKREKWRKENFYIRFLEKYIIGIQFVGLHRFVWVCRLCRLCLLCLNDKGRFVWCLFFPSSYNTIEEYFLKSVESFFFRFQFWSSLKWNDNFYLKCKTANRKYSSNTAEVCNFLATAIILLIFFEFQT